MRCCVDDQVAWVRGPVPHGVVRTVAMWEHIELFVEDHGLALSATKRGVLGSDVGVRAALKEALPDCTVVTAFKDLGSCSSSGSNGPTWGISTHWLCVGEVQAA